MVRFPILLLARVVQQVLLTLHQLMIPFTKEMKQQLFLLTVLVADQQQRMEHNQLPLQLRKMNLHQQLHWQQVQHL